MADLWNLASLGLFDALLGWLLELPRAVALVAVALVTALLLTLIRKRTTNQDRLRRAAADLVVLKGLRAAAKQAKDKEAVARLKATHGQISVIKLKAEGWPLLAVLLPLALLATWAFYRLEFQSPRGGETIEVVAYLPLIAQDDLLHLVPQPGLNAVNGWVQPVRIVQNEPTGWDRFWAKVMFHDAKPSEPDAVAIWQLQGDAARTPYPLIFRWKDRSLEREFRIGQRAYSPAWDVRPDEPIITEIRMRENRLLGIPGLGPWLPAWLVGYLIITIPLVPVLKRWLQIY